MTDRDEGKVALPGEGETKAVIRTRVRIECENCGEPATKRHTYLLPDARRNRNSSAFGKDDISWCSDQEAFCCDACKEIPDLGRYEYCATFLLSERFAHMFLRWKEKPFDLSASPASFRDGIEAAAKCVETFKVSKVENATQSAVNIIYETLANNIRALSPTTGGETGEDDDHQACEHCGKGFNIEVMTMMEDCWFCESCTAEWRKHFDACEHEWEDRGDGEKLCRKCSGVVYEEASTAAPTPPVEGAIEQFMPLLLKVVDADCPTFEILDAETAVIGTIRAAPEFCQQLIAAANSLATPPASHAMREALEWQPIETAPKDGTKVLAAWDAPTPEYRAVGVVFWRNDLGWLSAPGHWSRHPTHWQPLPAPPAALSNHPQGGES